MTYANRPDAGHALMTDDAADRLASEFDAAVEGAPKTWGPISRDLAREAARRELGDGYIEDDVVDLDELPLSTTADVQAALVEHQAIQRDLARDAAFGYSVEAELREVGPEPSDEPEPVTCVHCEKLVTQYDVNQHGQPLCFECCEDMERWDFR